MFPLRAAWAEPRVGVMQRRGTSTSIPRAVSTHAEALEFLTSRIDYERTLNVPYTQRDFRLDRMRRLLDRLGNPQAGLKIVHVAGTKGKGSTAASIASVLRCAGYRTGLYSSPHLDRVEERFTIDGQYCPAVELVDLVARIQEIVAGMDDEPADELAGSNHPTYFEIVTALALVRFAERQVDAAVLEVGLGGRLDSTNICQPLVSVITNISFDHMQQLGNTLAAIAGEKAGIIKPGVPVVSGVTQAEPAEVVERVAAECGCRLSVLGREFDFNYRPPRHLETAPAVGHVRRARARVGAGTASGRGSTAIDRRASSGQRGRGGRHAMGIAAARLVDFGRRDSTRFWRRALAGADRSVAASADGGA